MKFPSIKTLADSAIATLKRFPFEVLFAFIGTICATININDNNFFPDGWFNRILMTANLGLLLSLAATLFIAAKSIKNGFVFRLLAAILAACLIFIINPAVRPIDYLRFFLLSLAFHLLVAFAAFTSKEYMQGFWQFNKTLFLRFLAAVLYSAVLQLGLAGAIAAANFLFNLHLEYKIYSTLFAWIAGVFNTVFFLAGVPANTASLDSDTSYPKGLKVFTQYVLIPLASVYVIILLAYEIKILFQWSLPKGMVSNLILGYAVFGILAILLIYPLREQERNKWIKTYARSFYFLLIPLLVLLFLAIYSRILPYGITAPRYFLIVLAFWLLFITLYFLLSRKQNIKIIPVTLCILTLLSVYGPQSAFSVSTWSQRMLLINIFKKYGAFKDGKLATLDTIKVSKKDGENTVEKLRYFIFNSDFHSLQPCINENIDKVIDSLKNAKGVGAPGSRIFQKKQNSYLTEYEMKDKELDWATEQLGLNKFNKGGAYYSYMNYDFEAKGGQLLSTKGYDYVLSINNSSANTEATVVNGDKIQVKQVADIGHVYTLFLNNEKVSFNVEAVTDSLLNAKDLDKYANIEQHHTENSHKFTLPNQLLTFTKQTKQFKVRLELTRITCSNSEGGDINIYGVEGYYLISLLK